MQNVVRLNRERDYKIGTGFLTTPFVLEALTEAGASDDAYKTLTNSQVGWAAEVNAGATTIWENWEPTASLNHYSKGSCCQWLFDCVAGINLCGEENAFVIKPHTLSAVDSIDFSYDSVYGTVKSAWSRINNGYKFIIEIPSNCTAELELPNGEKHSLKCGEHEFFVGQSSEDVSVVEI